MPASYHALARPTERTPLVGRDAGHYDRRVTLARLPGWVIDNDASVREEVAPYVGATYAERLAATRACCRAAIRTLAFHFDPERALAYSDPLPPSTVAALERLRQGRR
jgi:hypothetical protein